MPSRHTRTPAETQPSSLNGIKLDAVGADDPVPRIGETGTYTAALVPPYGWKYTAEERHSAYNRYRRLLDYNDYGGAYELRDVNGRDPIFTVTAPDGASPLVSRLETPEESTIRSFWGLFDGVEPAETAPSIEGAIGVAIELRYMAPLGEYRTEEDFRRGREYTGI